MKVSVIIPSRNELFLTQTIDDILNNSSGEIEVIVALDGYSVALPDDKRIKSIRFDKPRGMRACINAAAGIATGEYLLKTDAHCSFATGFDAVLKADCDGDWIVIPSRYSLDAENWRIEQNRKPRRDYHYLCFPDPQKEHDGGMHGVEWWERGRERIQVEIDDTPSFQGSCWFMSRKHWNWLGGMSEVGYGTFSQEPQEIGMKTWLGGGAVKTNKRTWYAHLHKGKRYGRMYSINQREIINAHNWSAHHWVHNEEPNMCHKFDWFIDEKFPNMPTWTSDWKTRLGYVD